MGLRIQILGMGFDSAYISSRYLCKWAWTFWDEEFPIVRFFEVLVEMPIAD